MVRETPLIFIMFSVVILASAIVGLASYYGSDWTWIGEQVASLVLVFMVFSVAFYTLMRWLKR